eukprot:76703-Pyramimonas_sp.AAC.1
MRAAKVMLHGVATFGVAPEPATSRSVPVSSGCVSTISPSFQSGDQNKGGQLFGSPPETNQRSI